MRTPKLFSAVISLLCFSLFAAGQIRADGTTDYVYQANGNTFTWDLPTNPVIAANNVYSGEGFIIPDLSFSENGVSMVGTLDFYNASTMGGGFDLWSGSDYFCNAYGPQLYTGPEASPTLLGGNFSLLDYGNGNTPYGGTLAVSTPEPSTFYMLGIGLAMILGFVFLRKN